MLIKTKSKSHDILNPNALFSFRTDIGIYSNILFMLQENHSILLFLVFDIIQFFCRYIVRMKYGFCTEKVVLIFQCRFDARPLRCLMKRALEIEFL